jgi:hypothetical protein
VRDLLGTAGMGDQGDSRAEGSAVDVGCTLVVAARCSSHSDGVSSWRHSLRSERRIPPPARDGAGHASCLTSPLAFALALSLLIHLALSSSLRNRHSSPLSHFPLLVLSRLPLPATRTRRSSSGVVLHLGRLQSRRRKRSGRRRA